MIGDQLIRDQALAISNQQSKIRNLIILLFILALAAFLRFYLLDGQSFWNDEGNSARIAERSLQLITEGAAGDIHPPLYYYLLHFWRGVFGSSEVGAAITLGCVGRGARRADVPHRAQGI